MRHIFVINPVAGNGKHIDSLTSAIHTVCREKGADYEVYVTKGIGDATVFTKQMCEKGGELRFYACGGDGTVSEVVAGVYGYDNAQFAVIPCGSGNDFVRSFQGVPFLDIAAQLVGEVRRIDLIKTGHGLCVNLCSIGFDSAVAMNMVRFKNLPMVTGSMAYIMAIAYCFFHKLSHALELTIDGKTLPADEYVIGVCGNGSSYGGGFTAAPRASLEDGLLEIVLVKKISRLRFLSLVGKYKNGLHLEDKGFSDVITYTQARSFQMTAQSDVVVNYDGECLLERSMQAELLHGAIAFALPVAHVKEPVKQNAPGVRAKGVC